MDAPDAAAGPGTPDPGDRVAAAAAELQAALRAELDALRAQTARLTADVQELRSELQGLRGQAAGPAHAAAATAASPSTAGPAPASALPPVPPDAGLDELLRHFDAIRDQLADRGRWTPPAGD